MSQLEKKLSFSEHVVSTEPHDDGGKHFHALLLFPRKVDVRLVKVFAVAFEGEPYNCNCQSIRGLTAAVEYACKGKDDITTLLTGISCTYCWVYGRPMQSTF